MTSVVALASDGLTPALRNASNQLSEEMWDAVEKATDSGLPIGLLIGQIEFLKAAIIDNHFQQLKGEQ